MRLCLHLLGSVLQRCYVWSHADVRVGKVEKEHQGDAIEDFFGQIESNMKKEVDR